MIIFIITFPVKSLMSDTKVQQQILINMKYFIFSLQKQEKKTCVVKMWVMSLLKRIIILKIIFKIFVCSYNPIK